MILIKARTKPAPRLRPWPDESPPRARGDVNGILNRCYTAGMSSTAKRAVAARIGERRAASVERRGVDLFDADAFGPGPGDSLLRNSDSAERSADSRQRGRDRRVCPAVPDVRREHWSARVVLALVAVAAAAVAAVVVVLVAAGLGFGG
jgi:hypothetical protein